METEAKVPHLTVARIVPLWVLVFFTGWFIMQTELVGARALTPYFGNSIFVWGSVIAVFLLALALGYGLGGRLTTMYRSHWFPAILLAAAGALVGLSVLFQDPLCALLALKMDVRWGALLGSVILYGVPMILAGTISPYAVHLAAGARSEVGSRAGTLYSVSTIGSFIGSLVTSFLLIPSFSLPSVVVGGGIMVALAAIVTAISLSVEDRPGAVASLVFAVAALFVMTYSPRYIVPVRQQVFNRTIIGEKLSNADPSTLNDRIAQSQRQALAELNKYGSEPGGQTLLSLETAYHRVQVTQEGPLRSLIFGQTGFKAPQTMMNLNDVKRHVAEYTGMMMAPMLYKQDIKRALIIGLGGGDIARGIELCYPNIEMDVVEIDPAVVRIAQEYFFWKPSKNVTVYTMDGRSFVNIKVVADAKKYDWVIVDAFDSDYVPFHLTTEAFYQVLQMVMADDGVLAINTSIANELYSYQARTVQSAFGWQDAKGAHRGCLDAYWAHVGGNMILVAQKHATGPMTLDRALKAIKTVKNTNGGADLRYCISCLLKKPNWEPKGDILTDTWAPVERLIKAH